MIEVAVKYQKPVRIGVNWGSLDQTLLTRMMDENSSLAEPKDAREVTMEAMVVSALDSAALHKNWPPTDQIILSAKVSGVQDLIDVYRALAARCDYPCIWASRSGHGREGRSGIKRSHGRGIARRHRRYHPRFFDSCAGEIARKKSASHSNSAIHGHSQLHPPGYACPGCGRTTSTFFQEMAQQIQTYLREQMPTWKGRYVGVEEMKLAVMGCVVNGPANRSTPTSASHCPVRSKSPRPRSTWMDACSPRSKGIVSWRSSSGY